MKAVILAGGRGRRLGHLTESRPKPLIEISGKPLLEYLITYAAEAGIRDYLINTGYLGHMIQDYFGDGSGFGVSIRYLESGGKGPEGPIFIGREYIDEETFCCFCGDNILIPSQIEKILQIHAQRNADATFTLEEGESKKRVRVRDGRITASSTDPRDPVLVYNFAMQTAFLDRLCDFVKDRKDKAFAFAMDGLTEDHGLYVADIGPFININRPEDIDRAEIALKGGYSI